MNIVLLGAPGSGKGTQAEYLQAEFGLTHLATGDLFRQHLADQTELGLLAQQYMNQGQLVPDAVTVSMLRQRLAQSDPSQGVLLDGFPRTVAQADALQLMLHEFGQHLHAVLYIEVPEAELIDRLSQRRVCRECQVPFHLQFKPFLVCPEARCNGEFLYHREDDRPDTIRQRLQTFHLQTAPLIDYYRQANLLVTIAGSGDIAMVRQATLEAVRAIASPN